MRKIVLVWSLILTISAIHYSQTLSEAKTKSLDPPSRWLLVIGVSNYQDPEIRDLQFAAEDAKLFHKILVEIGKFPRNQARLLTDSEASQKNIKLAITDWLQNTTDQNSLVVIYFSGHGDNIDDYNGDEEDKLDEFILPYDSTKYSNSNIILDDVFADWIKNLPSKKIVIVFDSCYAGGGAKVKSPGLFELRTEIKTDNFVKDITRELPKEKGVAILASSSENQLSLEDPPLQHGVFTYFLCKSFGLKADKDGDKAISLKESYEYLKPLVIEYVESKFPPPSEIPENRRDEYRQTPIFINRIQEKTNLVFPKSFNSPMLSWETGTERFLFERRGRDFILDPTLGVYLHNLTPEIREIFAIDERAHGVVITQFAPQSILKEEGCRPGYVIEIVQGLPVNNVKIYKERLAQTLKPGEELVVRVLSKYSLSYRKTYRYLTKYGWKLTIGLSPEGKAEVLKKYRVSIPVERKRITEPF